MLSWSKQAPSTRPLPSVHLCYIPLYTPPSPHETPYKGMSPRPYSSKSGYSSSRNRVALITFAGPAPMGTAS